MTNWICYNTAKGEWDTLIWICNNLSTGFVITLWKVSQIRWFGFAIKCQYLSLEFRIFLRRRCTTKEWDSWLVSLFCSIPFVLESSRGWEGVCTSCILLLDLPLFNDYWCCIDSKLPLRMVVNCWQSWVSTRVFNDGFHLLKVSITGDVENALVCKKWQQI